MFTEVLPLYFSFHTVAFVSSALHDARNVLSSLYVFMQFNGLFLSTTKKTCHCVEINREQFSREVLWSRIASGLPRSRQRVDTKTPCGLHELWIWTVSRRSGESLSSLQAVEVQTFGFSHGLVCEVNMTNSLGAERDASFMLSCSSNFQRQTKHKVGYPVKWRTCWRLLVKKMLRDQI